MKRKPPQLVQINFKASLAIRQKLRAAASKKELNVSQYLRAVVSAWFKAEAQLQAGSGPSISPVHLYGKNKKGCQYGQTRTV